MMRRALDSLYDFCNSIDPIWIHTVIDEDKHTNVLSGGENPKKKRIDCLAQVMQLMPMTFKDFFMNGQS